MPERHNLREQRVRWPKRPDHSGTPVVVQRRTSECPGKTQVEKNNLEIVRAFRRATEIRTTPLVLMGL